MPFSRRRFIQVFGAIASSIRFSRAGAFAQTMAPQKHGFETDTDPALTMRFEQPAEQWADALPLGNGRLGAMVFGETKSERIALNEDTLMVRCTGELEQSRCESRAPGGSQTRA